VCTQRCLALVVLSWLLVPSPSVAQLFFRSDPLSATVVESGSLRPIAGAVVVVYWQLIKPKVFHGDDYEVLHRAETVTDRDGKFQIAAWGPKYGGLFWSMEGNSPYAYVLKSGYKFEIVSNFGNAFGGFSCPGSKFAEISGWTHSRSTIVASWNGCPIPLTKPTESPDNYASRLHSMLSDLCGRRTETECSEPVQRYFNEERSRLLKLGAKHYW
jgi:hypothetical protein